MSVLIIAALISAFVWFMVRKDKRKALAKARNMATGLCERHGFEPVLTETFCGNNWGLAIDPTNGRLAVAAGGTHRVLNFEQIVSVDALVDGHSINQGGGATNRSAVGFVIGDVVGGAFGAIAGAALMGGSKVQRLSVRILTDDLAQPWIDILFLNEKALANIKDKKIQPALRQWTDWHGRLMTIAARQTIVVAPQRPLRRMVA